MGPLAGPRVVDMTRILAGPWCTQILGDLGAEVIKIEHPTVGDDTRQWGPPWLQDESGNETGESSYYLSANRSKSSVTLDLKTERGRTILRELVAGADVFIENFKVGGLAKLELDSDSLKAVKADLVYLSITGFDDIELARYVHPALTTVHVPHREMGRTAARDLVAMIENGARPGTRQLDVSIVMRQSLAAP